MFSNAKVGMIRVSNDSFIMAHQVSRVVCDDWSEGDGCGTVLIYGIDGACHSIEREDATLLPVNELTELVARTIMHVLRLGEDVDLRPRMLAPRF